MGLLITLIKCLKGHKSPGSLCSVVEGLIVSGAGPTNQGTRSPIELFWTAKNNKTFHSFTRQVASNLGLSGRLKRLEGKVEAVEVKETKEVVENEEEREGTGGDGVKEEKKSEKNFKQTEEGKKLKESENPSERGDFVKRKEEMEIADEESNTDGENAKKGEKRNSFRLDYIAHMIRR